MSNLQDSRPIRIALTLNNRDNDYAPDLADQYTSPETRGDVLGALQGLGAEIFELEADGRLFERLGALADSVDLAFNLAEGLPHCHSRHVTVPMALDHLGVEWTGSRVEGHLVAANKALSRRILGDQVAQPRWWTLDGTDAQLPEDIIFPVLVKPIREGYSVGIDQRSVATSKHELEQVLLRLRARVSGPVLIESFLDGVEYSIGLVGDVVMPAVSWDLSRLPGAPKVRGEDLKSADLTIPHARLVEDPEIARSLATQAVAAHLGLGLLDYSRSDFRAPAGSATPHFLETNSMPGLQDYQSVLTWAAGQAGIAYQDVIGSVVALALRRLPPERRDGLRTAPFEAAFERLRESASAAETIHVQGRAFRMLQPARREERTADSPALAHA